MLYKYAVPAILPTILLAAIIGCGGETTPTKDSGNKPSAAKATDNDSAGEKTAADDLPGLKELSAADRALAEKQKYCPKTGELLGSMGKPYKIKLNGRDVFLCCDGCEEAVKKDPDKYLKKLDELMAKK